MPSKLALFASGSGSNAENIVTYFAGNNNFAFSLIISNKAGAFVHERAKKLNIPSLTFSREEFSDGKAILELLRKEEIDYIILAGFLLKIPQAIIDAYPDRIINIHPALLPKFGGKGMYGSRVHQAVIASHEKESGITIHYINERYDEGNTIFQATCPVLPTDTPDTLAIRVHQLEYEYFPRVIEATILGKNLSI